jgi:electron-transferring-flavoprotein dehydrogenase
MGGTSAFHEGGDHVAVRTGKIAGELAATDNLEQYNQKWQAALGTEFRRNVTMAAVVREYMPSDWDRTFAAADRMLNRGEYTTWSMLKAGLSGVKLVYEYKRTKRGFTGSSYVQYKQSEYRI